MHFKNLPAALLIAFIACAGCSSLIEEEDGFYGVEGGRNVPADFEIEKPAAAAYKNSYFTASVYSRGFRQGDAIYLECTDLSFDIDSICCTFLNKTMCMTKSSRGFRALVPIDPGAEPGQKEMVLIYKYGEAEGEIRVPVEIKKSRFETVYQAMYLGKYSHREYIEKDENKKRIERDRALKDEAFSSDSPDCLSTVISHPRDIHYITSPFWFTRVYSEYSAKNNNQILNKTAKVHRGIDLRGTEGSPVYSMERGRIVLAENLFFEGNMIIIDHGGRIFSYYMHLNRIEVEKGQMVKSGQRIGLVGATGRVTSAHLHVSFVINGVQVDPFSLFCLPVRR